jgi:predicted dehydrogenase
MDKVRLALIGAGGMANAVHYPSLAEFEEVEMAALCDLVPDKLHATADRFGIEKRYTDYRQMLEEAQPHAVYILMPPHHLFDLVIHSLERGLHVFIEKPPGVTTEQTRQMALLAEKRACLTMVGFQRRHIPIVRLLRGLVEERGPLTQAVCTFYKNAIGAPPYYGGATDILTCDAIHAVDFLRWACGEVKRVASDVRSLYADYANSFNALMTFESGATGVLLTNWTVGRRFFTFEMHSKGASALCDPDDKGHFYADNDLQGRHFDARELAGGEELRVYYGFRDENRHFIDCLKSGAQPTSCFADAVKTMELVDRIYRSQL